MPYPICLMPVLFALTIFTGAFLLFQVQPIIGKFILPWYGGGPAVWTTCLLMFQLLLLTGYLYAHLLTKYFKPAKQAVIHSILVIISLCLLPITPAESLRPGINTEPITSILILLIATVGMPYLILSATGPLMQGWFTRCMPGKSPYRLYALSNVGSMLALISYPFLVEPAVTRTQQTHIWSYVMAAFAILSIACAYKLKKGADHFFPTSDKLKVPDTFNSDETQISLSRRLLWLAFPAIACLELLAITAKITQDIAAIPFLWILPLAIYLLTFIICFDSHRWYKHSIFVLLFIAAIGATVWQRLQPDRFSLPQEIIIYLVLLFTCAMVCHGQLYHLRPSHHKLTSYYLMIAAGGALGGFIVAVICPLIFNSYIELNLGIIACIMLTLLADIHHKLPRSRRLFWALVIMIVGIWSVTYRTPIDSDGRTSLCQTRNFFGVITVWYDAADSPQDSRYLLQHGTTFHGIQFQDAAKRHIPTAYYGTEAGVGMSLDAISQQRRGLPFTFDDTTRDPLRIGVVGLGVGTIATYGMPSDYFCFYEIDPAVLKIAEDNRWFSFLSDCPSKYDVLIGDARLVMEGQLDQNFDLLVIDAFSSDSIPVHLLTVEAIEVYLRHLKTDGILAFHLSNRHLDLPSVVLRLADELGLSARRVHDDGDDDLATFAATWVLLSRDSDLLNTQIIDNKEDNIKRLDIKLWTDDFVNLFEILK